MGATERRGRRREETWTCSGIAEPKRRSRRTSVPRTAALLPHSDMTPFNDANYALASDGLPARKNGRYAEEKLRFLDDYLPPALAATANKHRRHVIDLFAGPGLNVDKHNTRYEFPGSPFREMRAHAPGHPRQGFSHAHFVNLDPLDHETLTTRVDRWCAATDSAIPRDRITLHRETADAALPQILRTIPALDYVFVFADIEGIQEFPWTMVEALRARGHRSLELYVLFPLQMTLQRLLAYQQSKRERYDPLLTAFFGTDE